MEGYRHFFYGCSFTLIAIALLVAFWQWQKWPLRADQQIVYKQIDGRVLKLHLFKSQSYTFGERPPLLMLFHGGAWQYGSPSSFFKHCKFFAAHGITCASVEYRTESRDGTDPRAAVSDAYDAFLFVRNQAIFLDVDEHRIVLGGGSSGGHLAAAVATKVPLLDSDRVDHSRPAAIVLYNPMLDLSPCQPDHHLVRDYWETVSPLHAIDTATPPALLLSGTDDPEVPVITLESFCKEMNKLGGNCQLELYEGAKHGFFNPSVNDGNYFTKTNERVLRYFKDVFATKSSG